MKQLLLGAALAALVAGCGGNIDTPYTGDPTAPSAPSGGANWDNNLPPPPIHNTNYCQVDAQGHVLSSDQIQVQDGDRVHGVGGGCIARPIREVWGVILNHPYMKDDQVDEYKANAVPSLLDFSKKIYFVFDIESTVHALGGLVTVDWMTRWFHSVKYGTYEKPYQLVVNLAKISGSSFVNYDQEGYVIDRVTENVTSFVMEQTIKAEQVDTNRVHKNIATMLNKMRAGTPNWSVLTPHPQASSEELPDSDR